MEENKNPHIRVLFCADKTPNMRDMNRLLAKGHVPEKIAVRYRVALSEFRNYGTSAYHD